MSFGLISTVIFTSCKHSPKSDLSSEGRNSANLNATLFDINDVSILVAQPSLETRLDYLRLDAKTAEGPLLTKEQFSALGKMLVKTRLLPYTEWAMAAVRIDNCGKLLPAHPCQPQIRLTFQPLLSGADIGNEAGILNPTFIDSVFGDAALHLAFDINADAMQMYQDFLDLKKLTPSISTSGKLDVHPVLKAQGMKGPFAKKLNEFVLKYSLPSRYNRIAIMGTMFRGFGADWEFAATTEIKDGKFVQSPLPCQPPSEKTNIFSVKGDFLGLTTHSVTPSAGCPDTDITAMVSSQGQVRAGDNIHTQRAIRIENPEVTAFASTNCVSCHKTDRLMMTLGSTALAELKAKTEGAFKAPSGVSNKKAADAPSFSGGSWELRAFGWGEAGSQPGISGFTLNDSMRIAHELNELVRQGKLK